MLRRSLIHAVNPIQRVSGPKTENPQEKHLAQEDGPIHLFVGDKCCANGGSTVGRLEAGTVVDFFEHQ